MKKWFDYITVFIAVFLLDVVWTAYIVQVSNKNALLAAIYSVFLYLSSAYALTKYMENKKMLIPATLGAFIGTYLVVSLS